MWGLRVPKGVKPVKLTSVIDWQMPAWWDKVISITLRKVCKGLEIVHQERRGQVKAIVVEHFSGILFHKSGPANKQHTNQLTNQIYKCRIS